MAPPPNQGRKYEPCRPLLSQPPLTIENLPRRIQQGEFNVLPPKFGPPTFGPPGTAMGGFPSGPCSPYGPQPPQTCCYPPPCTPYPPPPCPQPMCCPPPCPPVMVCTPNFCSPYPCMPPPQCCPPPPCPPPPCQPCVPKCCMVKPGCCPPMCCGGGGGSGRCCGGPKQIVCLPKGTKPIVGCGVERKGGGEGGGRIPNNGGFNKHSMDQPASYNNCNFYLSEIPKGLRDRFGLMPASSEECTGEETEEGTEESTSSCRDEEVEAHCEEEEEEEECVEDVNRPAGDDQIIHPPVGYPGSQRVPWGNGFPGLTKNPPPGTGRAPPGTGYAPPGTGYPYGNGGGCYGPNYNSGGRGGTGTGSRGGRCTGGRGTRGGGTANQSNRGRNSFNDNNNNRRSDSQRGATGTGRSNYGAGNRTAAGSTRDGRSARTKPSNYTARSNQNTIRSAYANDGAQTSVAEGSNAKDAFAYQDGYRPYPYSEAELTHKSEAYLPENYTEPPPHTYDSRIHPLRAPITNYKSQSHWDDDKTTHASTFRTGTGTSMYPSRVPTVTGRTEKCTTSRANTSGLPWCSTVPSGTTAARTGRTGTTNMPYCSTTGTSRNGTTTYCPSKSERTNMPNGNGSNTYMRSEPDLRPAPKEEEQDGIPVYRSTTQTQLQIIERPNEPSEVRVVQRPVQEIVGYQKSEPALNHSHINLDIHTEDKRERHMKPEDPCHPRGCLRPHTRRLHRLCSFSTRRRKRLSQLHKPIFHFKAPPCPIRETVASILRKRPPADCKWHDKSIPPYHEFCMADRNPDTNRYPLLTQERMNFMDDNGQCEEPKGPADQHNTLHNSKKVEKRGVKRRLHHR